MNTNKLHRVLIGTLEHTDQILDTVYLERIIGHLSHRSGPNDNNHTNVDLLGCPRILDWVHRSIDNTDNAQLYAFTLRLLSLLMANEQQRRAILESDVCSKISAHLAATCETNNPPTPSVKLAHVQVMLAVLRHPSDAGHRWLISNQAWQPVLSHCLAINQTVYVTRAALEFIDQFMLACSSQPTYERVGLDVIDAILAPLEAAVRIPDRTVHVDDSGLKHTLVPCLQTLGHLMEFGVRLDDDTSASSCIVRRLLLVRRRDVRLWLWRLTDMTKDESFFKHIVGVMILLGVLEFLDGDDDDDDGDTNADSIDARQEFKQHQLGSGLFNHLKLCLVHRSAYAFVSTAQTYLALWTTLSANGRVPEAIELDGERFSLANQMLALQLLPVILTVRRDDGVDPAAPFDDYLGELLHITDQTLRVCGEFRQQLGSNRAMLADVACKSVQSVAAIERTGDDVHRRAVQVFRALSHLLRCATGSGDAIGERLLSAILTGLHSIVHNHIGGEHRTTPSTTEAANESMCLLDVLLAQLSMPNLSARLTVQALQLSQVLFENFGSERVEHLKSKKVDECVGTTLMRKLHDISWEVRDSALELLGAITEIAAAESYQRYILELGLCDAVVQMAMHDSESFVRASAIKNLGSMVRLQMLWNENLVGKNLMNHLLETALTEHEGIVRKECCMLITTIYRMYEITDTEAERIFPTMAHMAINDLHWECKVNALHFWRCVIEHQFALHRVDLEVSNKNDGITSTPVASIERSLDRILDVLHVRGALGVLLECLQDACDLHVVKMATSIAQQLQACLIAYDYVAVDSTATVHADRAHSTAEQTTDKTITSDTDHAMADSVIDAIVQMDDISLLENTKVPHGKSNPIPHLDPAQFEQMLQAKPADYLERIASLQLNGLVEQRSAWLLKNESFDSLLDDMLFSLDCGDANNADCY